jgi:hypothetical protein
MRRVEIVEDPRSQQCCIAVDVKSGEAVMRLHDRGLLERLCTSLEWKVVRPLGGLRGLLDSRFARWR